MTLATIKKMAIEAGFIVLSPKEYKTLLMPRNFKTFKPTKVELRDLKEGEREYREGKLISWEDAKRQLGLADKNQSS